MMIDDILRQVTQTASDTFKMVFMRRYGNSPLLNTIETTIKEVRVSIAIATLISGRRPGRFPPWGLKQGSSEKTALMDWVMSRFGADQKEAKTISYLIARKLKEQGSDIYRGLKPKLDTEEARQAADMKMRELIIEELKNKINKH